MFLRFTIGESDVDSNSFKGLFTAAYEIRDSGHLTENEAAEVQELIDWFKKNLTIPDCFFRAESKSAICWFTANAGEPLSRIWRLATFLRGNGKDVWLHKTSDPGRRLYSDRHQVVAIPQRRPRVRSF
jgi:hypothetical protein